MMHSPFSIQPHTGGLCGGSVLCPGLGGCLWEIQGEWSACWQDKTHLLLLLFIIVCVLVPQSCPTLCNPEDCSPSDSSIHGILQARILEWVAISFSRGSSGSNPHLLHRRKFLCRLSYQGSPCLLLPSEIPEEEKQNQTAREGAGFLFLH